jgi:uncharacterized protein with HEPN domain
MREQVKDRGRLAHILESIDNVFEFTKNVDYDHFISNKLLRFAVIKNIQPLKANIQSLYDSESA